ncbi:threonine ammonia-lyase, biosynthetic [Acidipropionibacterium timonense]|uniref:threonine ammonia-lyase, biosynthetic n=1 Tax=Acidipropionibacterium timonense TaxID=2161818 RepID=UPI00102F9AC0|nr:threonine ammonia-lyase, biosynthetic [Acidipropionibacterium timonense]
MTPQEYLRAVLRAPVYEVAVKTPLDPMPALSARLGNTVLLKREDRQPVHSFKIRGAYNRMRHLSADEQAAGVVTASAGNHAQGVALSGARLGMRAVIVMPVTTPSIKVDAVRALGGEVVLHGQTFDAAKTRALELARTEGLTFVAPFDDPLVIAGQGTIGLELVQDDARLDAVFVPVGGGGLAAGIAVLVKQLMPEVAVIGVEPEESACLAAALEAGHPVTLDRVSLFAEGVAVARVGDETFRVLSECLDDVVTVSSDQISAAVKDIFDDTRAVAEPAGAVGLAGLKKYSRQHGWQGKRLATVLSGANLNFGSLRYIAERAELGAQREGLFGVAIPERPGAFLDFCRVLGDRMVTEFNYRLADSDVATIFVGTELHSDAERGEILGALRNAGYHVVDLSEDEAAKAHVRYMVGGHPSRSVGERVASFEFPESHGALVHFLTTLGARWNISLFHYRSFGMDTGRVLAGFEGAAEDPDFTDHLDQIGYPWNDVSDSPAYSFFLREP